MTERFKSDKQFFHLKTDVNPQQMSDFVIDKFDGIIVGYGIGSIHLVVTGKDNINNLLDWIDSLKLVGKL